MWDNSAMGFRFAPARTLTAIALALLPLVVLGAQITVAAKKNYQRYSFHFAQPAQLSLSGSGTALSLHFSQPLNEPADALIRGSGGAITRATLSADRKTVTLTLARAYKTRRFVSGGEVGFDLIGADQTPDAATPAPAADAAVLTTKKPAPADAPQPPPRTEQKTKNAGRESGKTSPPPATKKAAAAAAQLSKPAILNASAAPPNPAADILTTKHPPAAQQLPELSHHEEVPAPKPAAKPAPKPQPDALSPEALAAQSPVAMPAAEPPSRTLSVKPADEEADADQKPSPTAMPPSMHTQDGEATLNFPFRERTAAAVFERARDIWIVFSRESPFNAALLRSIMPKQVAGLTRYTLPGATVLRLATDGSIHASAALAKDGYGWNIRLSARQEPPALPISLGVDSLAGERSLLFDAFDVAPPITFYDPNVGDKLMIAPAYESGRGVEERHKLPELIVLPSAQGIVLVSARDDVTASASRRGVSVTAPGGLAISEHLETLRPLKARQSAPGKTVSGVLMPYEQWRVAPDKFDDERIARQAALADATAETRAQRLMDLVTLYLGAGLGGEALGYLQLLESNDHDYYLSAHAGVLKAAALSLERRYDEAVKTLEAPDLQREPEAALWREYLALYAPAKPAGGEAPAASPAPSPDASLPEGDDHDTPRNTALPLLRFLKYQKPFIRFYPPRIRQLLAAAAADAYIANGLEEKALATLDTLNQDGILGPVRHRAEYALALVSVKNKKMDEALPQLQRLAAQTDDPLSAARARLLLTQLAYRSGELDAGAAAEAIESIRDTWRGDSLERAMLQEEIALNQEAKRYGDTLRAYKNLVDNFPGDPQYLQRAGDMAALFESLYLDGLADSLPPLQALALFYEFRELTPIGDKGDRIIQRLADRLAALDLLDQAAQLLENQIKFRLSGEERARVGARLAVLYLLNKHPQQALDVLEVTNYGTSNPPLEAQRRALTAEALSNQGKYEQALGIIGGDNTLEASLQKLDILWKAQDWPNLVSLSERILAGRRDLTAPLNTQETDVLLKLALGYSFERDNNQLRYLRDYYMNLMPDSGLKQVFDFITNDTRPLDQEDAALLVEQIGRTENFMNQFKTKIAAGKLSETVK